MVNRYNVTQALQMHFWGQFVKRRAGKSERAAGRSSVIRAAPDVYSMSINCLAAWDTGRLSL